MTRPIRFNDANLSLLREVWAAEDAVKNCKTQQERADAQEKLERIKAVVFDKLTPDIGSSDGKGK